MLGTIYGVDERQYTHAEAVGQESGTRDVIALAENTDWEATCYAACLPSRQRLATHHMWGNLSAEAAIPKLFGALMKGRRHVNSVNQNIGIEQGTVIRGIHRFSPD